MKASSPTSRSDHHHQREILSTIEGAKRPAYHAAAELAKELRGYAARACTPCRTAPP